ncbi:glycosyltransferase family 4 protein [Microbacterium sp. RD1]|uniref:glycosyltransferase family 4 protein n=1 Tax=Microbacterium sp. RD1 TaxID=3457313 RepID=UPI003FA58259
MKLLLIAPHADREATGESALAFEWVARMARRHDATVLTYRQRSGRRLSEQLPDVRIVEWQDPPLIGRNERFSAMLNPGYPLFRARARRWIRRALARGERFDVAHQVTPVSLRYASPLSGLGVPYVLGPLGGSLTSPEGFAAEEGGAPWFTALRRLDGIRLRRSRGLRSSFADAACVVGIAPYVAELLSDVPVRELRIMSDVGIDELPAPARPSRRTTGVRFLFVGRVIRTKGVRDAIRALALLPPGTAALDIVGDGYDREGCQQLVAELGLGGAVRFHGHVAHDEVADFYRDADVFLFPSYREAGGIVVLEAMSYGLPLIVSARGGPAAAVDSASGIRVEARDPAQYARDLAAAMAELASSPARRRAMGRSARARVAEEFLWDRRVATMDGIYADARARLSSGQPR